MPKKRKARNAEWPVFYVVEISDWDWSFSFGLDGTKYSGDPYSDFRHLEITGSLISPTIEKVEKVTVHLLPDADLNKSNRLEREPIAVGSLRLDDSTLQGLISMPLDALDSILLMLETNRIKFILMQGQKLRYRQSPVTNYSLQRELDEDDLLLE